MFTNTHFYMKKNITNLRSIESTPCSSLLLVRHDARKKSPNASKHTTFFIRKNSDFRSDQAPPPPPLGALRMYCILAVCRGRDKWPKKKSFQSITILSCQADDTFLPFRRTSYSNFLSVQVVTTLHFTVQPDFHPWATHAHFSQYFSSRVSNISSGEPNFTFELVPEAPPPHFWLCGGT